MLLDGHVKSLPIGERPTQPPIQWVPAVFFGAKARPGRDADHSLTTGAEIKTD
jgi:hypothetical protein